MLQTEVKIGAVKLGLLNQLILEDVLLQDQSAHDMLEVTRLAAQFEIIPLFNQRIVINSLQLFDFTANLNRQNPEAIPNYQFLVDALASKDTIDQSAPINLRLNTVLIRKGDLAYNVASAPETPNCFNPNHISVSELFATLSVKALQSDSINASIRRLSFKEQSGFSLNKLSTKVIANNQHLQVSRLSVELPNSLISIDTLQA
ncbi:MAG: translocation/assembly module TamB domain-containing protein, partial [Phocaeicola sp.]